MDNLTDVMYTAYCQAVGGKAFNGDDLPTWDVFANDPKKQKQVNAWRVAAKAARKYLADKSS